MGKRNPSWSSELFSENYSYNYIKRWFSNKKCNDFEKNGNGGHAGTKKGPNWGHVNHVM